MKQNFFLSLLFIVSSFVLAAQQFKLDKVNQWIAKGDSIRLENPYKSLVFLDSAKIVSKSNNLSNKLIDIYKIESNIFRRILKQQQAKIAQYEGLRIAEKLHDSLNIILFKVELAAFSTENHDYQHALGVLSDAVDFFTSKSNYENLARTYNIQGRVHMAIEEYQEAETSYLHALENFLLAGDSYSASKIKTNLGIATFNLGKLDESKEYLFSTLEKSIAENDIVGIQNSYGNLAEYYYLNDDIDSSYFHITKAYNLSERSHLSNYTQIFAGFLSNLHEKQNNLDSALFYKKLELRLRDSISAAELNLASVELDKLFISKSKDAKVELRENDDKEASSSLRNIYFICGVFLLLMVAVVYFAYRQQNRLNRELLNQRTANVQKNKLIDTALKEKEILLKEIHHRVKNNLQIISSLLNLQSRTITDEKALRALGEGRNRIQAIALLHQKLYQNETFSTVELKDYLDDLTQSLKHTLTSADKTIEIEITANDIMLNLDTAVPLGLIISELVTNSLKHAFKYTNNGRISIEVTKTINNRYIFELSDNGKGLPEGFKIPMEGSLGTEIIEALSEQLEGQLTFERNRPGAFFQLIFTEVSSQ